MNQLPWEMEEKILSLLPIISLGRFRSVCKRWNTLYDDKNFVNKLLANARPQFILHAKSKICSVDVNLDLDDGPSIKVHDLPSDIPGYALSMPTNIEYCDGLLVYVTPYGTGICNPWLKQIRWIKSHINHHNYNGMGYDNSRPDNHYKIFQSSNTGNTRILQANISEFGSDDHSSPEFAYDDWNLTISNYSVSLNGTLYWVALNRNSHEPFIQSFNFSTNLFEPYCILPSRNGSAIDGRSLDVYRKDRLSFLEQDHQTRNIEIWVTKEKIKNGSGEDVEWMKLMNVSVPKWSNLKVSYRPPSYFIDEGKSLSLVLCCHNNEEKASIYIAKEDKFHEIRINGLADFRPRHRTYFPSLVPVPTFTRSDKGKNQKVWSRFTLPTGVEANCGVGGNEWDDGSFDDVKQISIGWSSISGVVFVKFEYRKGNAVVVGPDHGPDLGDENNIWTIMIDDGDYIKDVEGTYTESHITSIAFRFHRKEKHHFGHFEGSTFVLGGGGGGSKIIGFYGKSSDAHLTAIGVHLTPV